jgi:hypothetical protein
MTSYLPQTSIAALPCILGLGSISSKPSAQLKTQGRSTKLFIPRTSSNILISSHLTIILQSFLDPSSWHKYLSNTTTQASWARQLLPLPVVPMATLRPFQLYIIWAMSILLNRRSDLQLSLHQLARQSIRLQSRLSIILTMKKTRVLNRLLSPSRTILMLLTRLLPGQGQRYTTITTPLTVNLVLQQLLLPSISRLCHHQHLSFTISRMITRTTPSLANQL